MEQVVELNTHIHLEHSLRIGGAIPPIPSSDFLYLPGYYVIKCRGTFPPRPSYFDMPSPFGATLTQILCVPTQLSTIRDARLKATLNIVSALSVGWIYCLVPRRKLRACPHIISAIDLTENFASAAHPLCVCVPTYVFKNHIQLFEYRTEVSA
jgi:hypothetical protein